MTKEIKTPAKRQGIQVLARAADILRLLNDNPEPASLGHISKEVGLPRSTVQRIIDALAKEGFVISGSSANGVRLGPAFLAMAESAHFSVVDVARPVLENLASATNESIVLTTLNKNNVLILDHIQGSNRLVSILEVGSTLPLHSSASGKAMLAAIGIEKAKKLMKKKDYIEHTSNTIITWDALEPALLEIQNTGIALDYEEQAYGVCSIAIAIKTVTENLIAIAVSIPTIRWENSKDRVITELKAQAKILQKNM